MSVWRRITYDHSWRPERVHGAALAQDLPLEDPHRWIAESIELASSPGKHAGRSAIFHLGRAWQIRASDPEMAAFRALSAEEEASTAIIHALKRKQYVGARRLSVRNHGHKNAVALLVRILPSAIPREVGKIELTIRFPESHERSPVVWLLFPGKFNPQKLWVAPTPPLNFSWTLNGEQHDFSEELALFAAAMKVDRLLDFVRERANERNRILYAGPEGIPVMDPASTEAMLVETRNQVFDLLLVYLLIEKHPLQLFVQQCLDVFIDAIGKAGGVTETEP